MSNIQYQQTVMLEQQQQELLTKESFVEWLNKRAVRLSSLTGGFAYLEMQKYLKEHGLPLNSKIEGL